MRRTVLFIDAEPAAAETFKSLCDETLIDIVTLHPDSFEMALVPARVDLVIINVTTAEGLETLQVLKQNPATAQLHIIALVAKDTLYAGDSPLEAGADGAIGLPLDARAVSHIMTFLMQM